MEMIRRLLGNSWLAAQLTSPRILKYFENVSWLIFEKVFTLAVAMVVNIYVARYLQPENFGLLNYAMSFVGIFSAFTTLGIDQIMVRELSKDPAAKNQILGTGYILKLAGSCSLTLVMLVILPFMNNGQLTNTLILIIASAEIFKSFEVVNSFFQSKVMSKKIVQVQLVVNMAGSVAKIAFVYAGAPLVWFAWIIFLNGLLNATGYILNYRKMEGSLWRWNFSKRLALSLLGESWPLIIHGFALLTQARVDQVMIGKLISNAEVGQYSVALRFIEIFSFVPIVLFNTFIPAVTKARGVSPELYQNRLVNLYRLMFVMFIVVAVPVYLFAEDVVVLLYGVEYQAAGFLLSLFAIRLFYTNMGLAKSVYTINESLFKFSLLATVLGAIANISLNLWLIPLYGSVGAIMASIVSFTLSDFIVDWFYRKTRVNQKLLFRGIFSFWKLNEVFDRS